MLHKESKLLLTHSNNDRTKPDNSYTYQGEDAAQPSKQSGLPQQSNVMRSALLLAVLLAAASASPVRDLEARVKALEDAIGMKKCEKDEKFPPPPKKPGFFF